MREAEIVNLSLKNQEARKKMEQHLMILEREMRRQVNIMTHPTLNMYCPTDGIVISTWVEVHLFYHWQNSLCGKGEKKMMNLAMTMESIKMQECLRERHHLDVGIHFLGCRETRVVCAQYLKS